MSGYEDWNFPLFFEVERELKELGYEVINPAHNDGPTLETALQSAGTPSNPGHTWAYYMRRDLPHVLEVDALCVLPNWQNSKGASLEVHVAEAIGVPIMILRDGELIPRVTCIGMAGYARSGKDTVAAYLIEHEGYIRMSFADPIREALLALDPMVSVGGYHVPLRQAHGIYGWEGLKTSGVDVRGLLQRLGTEVGREMFGEDFWVEAALSRAEDGAKIVFADVRFPNEANAIKKLGGKVYRVERDGVGPANDHISERALDDYEFDAVIDNGGSIELLYSSLGAIL
jgi:hypothetical protein